MLHLVLNYTGDVLNFEMAAELAEVEGIEVATVVIDDDVAVENSTFTAGRRGVAGAITAMKMTGAATDLGYDLAAAAAACTKINDAMGTILRQQISLALRGDIPAKDALDAAQKQINQMLATAK